MERALQGIQLNLVSRSASCVPLPKAPPTTNHLQSMRAKRASLSPLSSTLTVATSPQLINYSRLAHRSTSSRVSGPLLSSRHSQPQHKTVTKKHSESNTTVKVLTHSVNSNEQWQLRVSAKTTAP